jgi:hypothetical protein
MIHFSEMLADFYQTAWCHTPVTAERIWNITFSVYLLLLVVVYDMFWPLEETSQSHETTDGHSVCLSVKPRLGSWPDINYCLTVMILSLWREDGSVICHSHSPSIVNMQIMFTIFHVQYMVEYLTYVYTVYTRPLTVQAENSRSCSIISSSRYDGGLVTWMVIRLTCQVESSCIFSGVRMTKITNIPDSLFAQWLHLAKLMLFGSRWNPTTQN